MHRLVGQIRLERPSSVTHGAPTKPQAGTVLLAHAVRAAEAKCGPARRSPTSLRALEGWGSRQHVASRRVSRAESGADTSDRLDDTSSWGTFAEEPPRQRLRFRVNLAGPLNRVVPRDFLTLALLSLGVSLLATARVRDPIYRICR